MMAPHIAPYGSWASPITSEFVVAETIGLADLRVAGEVVYWVEARSTENGRNVLVRRRADGAIEDLTPPPFNVRTRVHEYGGGSYVVAGETIFFSNFANQLLYRLAPGGVPRPFSTRPDARYADGRLDAQRRRLVLVRENHAGSAAEPINTIVALPLDDPGSEIVLAAGADFYAAPSWPSCRRPILWGRSASWHSRPTSRLPRFSTAIVRATARRSRYGFARATTFS
jgi:hypothetical protein